MKFNPNNFYHIFNRGNNKQPIFALEKNYSFFLLKLKESTANHCSILAYCLMPNHFHLLIYTDSELKDLPNGKMQILERKLGTLQSSYTGAINNQEGKIGSLFQPKCKVVELKDDHRFICFHYIHQNPFKAGLTKKPEQWEYSSFNEYFMNKARLCNKTLAYNLLDVPSENDAFYRQSCDVIV